MNDSKQIKKQTWTTRRGFIGGLGLSSISLAALWTGYGAMKSGHAHGGQLMSVEQFEGITDQFIADNLQDDGSVMPKMMDQTMGEMGRYGKHAWSSFKI